MKVLLALILICSSAMAMAIPEAPFDALKADKLKFRQTSAASEYDFEGIVKLSNCSGSLIIFSGQPTSSKAWVMTNGHCIQKPGGYLAPGEVWVNRSINREMKIFDSSMNLFPIRATKIVYATMTDTDLAYYELDQSYDEIAQNYNVRPLSLDTLRPSIAQPIEIISGYWDRGYSCAIDNFIFQVKEGSWVWTDSIRYTASCDTIGGTSGSPIIAKGERRVVGVNNTSNESGQRCTLNNPCEVSERGEVTFQKGVRYGQQTYNTYSCLSVDFQIDLTLSGCELPK